MNSSKTKLIQATIQILGNSGSAGLSAANVAKLAGVSKSTLFHHFESVESLTVEAFEYLVADLLVDSEKTASAKTLEDYLMELGINTLELCKSHSSFLSAYFTFCCKALFMSDLKERLSLSYECSRVRLQEQVQAFGLPTKSAEEVSHQILSSLDGMSFHYLLFKNERRFTQSWKSLICGICLAHNQEN